MTNRSPINFTRGIPAAQSFPTKQMIEASQLALQQHGSVILQYGPSYGFRPLREWLADWHGVEVDSVLCSNGSLQIIKFICSVLMQTKNKTVFVEAPTYDRTITMLQKHGAKIVSIPLQTDGPDIEVLEHQLHQHQPAFFYVIPDFQNPAGVTCSREKREKLIELGRNHGYIYLEDAPYRALRYRGIEEPSLFELAPDVVLHMSSFSKLIGPGPRMGYILGDSGIVDRVAEVAERTYITPGLLSHGIIYEFCRAGHLPQQIERLKTLYKPLLDSTLAAVDQYLPEAESTKPDGGFFLSVTIPKPVTTMDVRNEASSYNLSLSDGRGFFANGGGDNFLRIPYCALTPEQIRDGVSRLAEIVRQLHPTANQKLTM